VRAERERLVKALSRAMVVEPGFGPVIVTRPFNPDSVLAALARYGVSAERADDRLRLPVSAKAEMNDRLLAALGLAPAPTRPHRTGESVRDTKETRIVCAID